MKKALIIGSGFSGLSTASFLAKEGWNVTVIEKHAIPGGRARKLEANGFVFDMGPSWYWMPDVFERYFQCFGKNRSDYYKLKRLDPSYTIYWKDELMNIPAEYEKLQKLFEKTEKGSGKKLDTFLQQGEYKYKIGINKLVQNGISFREAYKQIGQEIGAGTFSAPQFSMDDHTLEGSMGKLCTEQIRQEWELVMKKFK